MQLHWVVINNKGIQVQKGYKRYNFRIRIHTIQFFYTLDESFPLIKAALADYTVNSISFWSKAIFSELGGRGYITESSQKVIFRQYKT